MTAYRYGIVGNGWRAAFYHRAARSLPDRLQVVGVVSSSPESTARAAAQHDADGYASVQDLVATGRPDFVVVSVPSDAAPAVVVELAEARIPVLLETPPASDRASLEALWSAVGGSGLVQVAEQYFRYPGHAARRALIDRGLIGVPTSVQVSSTHEYHAVSIMRSLLGVGRGEAKVRASAFVAPLVDPLTRDAWTHDDTEHLTETVLATIDFGDGRMGLYDFTWNQWHNQLRHRRIVVRGSRGEIVDDRVVHLAAPEAVINSQITRRQLGYDLDLDGYATEHLSLGTEVLWSNPFPRQRFSDEEIAIADMLVDTGTWATGAGAPSYPLAEAMQDHAITLAIREALATGTEAYVTDCPWF